MSNQVFGNEQLLSDLTRLRRDDLIREAEQERLIRLASQGHRRTRWSLALAGVALSLLLIAAVALF